MGLIVDFLLLAASGAACFYCWVLSSRLKALTSSKSGLQTGIAALSQSAQEIQTAMADTKQSAETQAEALETLIRDADERINDLRVLSKQIVDVSHSAIDDTEGAMMNLIAALEPRLEEARTIAQSLTTAIAEAPGSCQPGDEDDDDAIEVSISAESEPMTASRGEAA